MGNATKEIAVSNSRKVYERNYPVLLDLVVKSLSEVTFKLRLDRPALIASGMWKRDDAI